MNAGYLINTWIQVGATKKKKKERRAMCSVSKGAREQGCTREKKESDRETETDVSFGEAVSSSTSMSDACAARCWKSVSERREERRRRKKTLGRCRNFFFFYVTALTAPLHCTELK